jgi:acyl-CoA thioesterase-1
MNIKSITFLLTFLMTHLLYPVSAQTLIPDTNYLSAIKTELNKPWPGNRTINIIFHGHSVPAGYWHDHEVHTLESYPNLLLRKLKSKYPYAVINIIVTAIGGENALKGQLRFDSTVLSHKPDVIIVDYALNDRFSGLEKSKAAWEKMISSAIRRNIKVILVTPSPDQRVDIIAKDNELEQHARQISRLAVDFKVGLADPFSLFQKIKKDGGNLGDYMSHVNHPNEKGHEIIADEIMKWFN